MAWDLQSHMHAYVEPSIAKEIAGMVDPHDWLIHRYADQRWNGSTGEDSYTRLLDEADRLPQDTLISVIAEVAIERGRTTNGGHAVYLDDWHSVPFCSDEEMQAWHS